MVPVCRKRRNLGCPIGLLDNGRERGAFPGLRSRVRRFESSQGHTPEHAGQGVNPSPGGSPTAGEPRPGHKQATVPSVSKLDHDGRQGLPEGNLAPPTPGAAARTSGRRSVLPIWAGSACYGGESLAPWSRLIRRYGRPTQTIGEAATGRSSGFLSCISPTNGFASRLADLFTGGCKSG